MTISPWFATAELLNRIAKVRAQMADRAEQDKKPSAAPRAKSPSGGSQRDSERS
jgi:hypothetical protein